MSARRWLAFACGLLLAAPALACINETGTNRYGKPVPVEIPADDLPKYLTHGDRGNLVDWATEITRKARAEPGYDSHNQLAVALIRLGRPKPAIELKLAGTAERAPSPLGLDYGRAPMPVAPARMPAGNDGQPVDASALDWHLFTQLHERTGLVPPKDPVVARLFFNWGNNEMLHGTVENADVAYGFALEYGHPDAGLISRRRAEIARILAAVR